MSENLLRILFALVVSIVAAVVLEYLFMVVFPSAKFLRVVTWVFAAVILIIYSFHTFLGGEDDDE